MSAAEPSATWPITSSVAGLTLSNTAPDEAPTSLPSISMLGSGSTVVVVAMVLPRAARRSGHPLILTLVVQKNTVPAMSRNRGAPLLSLANKILFQREERFLLEVGP